MPAALPPTLRHRMADAVMAALHDARARHALAVLGADADAAHGWCGPADAAYGDLVQARARRAAEALAAVPLGSAAPALEEALGAAAALFDASLFFEAHEVLEAQWRGASGDTREALQGLIQIAVGYQHWVHGNWRGARSLLEEGSARVQGRRALGLSLDAFAEAVTRASERMEGTSPSPPPFPRRPRRARSSPDYS